MKRRMQTAPSVLGILGTIAEIATSSRADVEERLADILEAAGAVVHVDGWMVWAVDPVTGARRRLYASGYPETLMGYLDGPGFEVEVVAPFSHAPDGWPTRVRDQPYAPGELRCMSDHYLPLGFVEGCVAPLSSSGGRCTGFLDCIASSQQHPSDDARDLLAAMAGVVGRMIDPVESRARASALLLDERVVLELDGSGTGARAEVVRSSSTESDLETLERCGGLLALVDWSATAWWAAQFLWEDPDGAWHRCRCVRRGGRQVLLGMTPTAARPYGLSRRELEVLTLVAEGASNDAIARRLVVTVRTAKAHVEHILEKLEVSSRTAAMTKAVEEGLLLRPPSTATAEARPPTVARPVPNVRQATPLVLRDLDGIALSSSQWRTDARASVS
ncbi:MAG: response regulator transcription factor [Solirubrobacteraceae bacterium]